MKLRYGIPFMILLAALATLASRTNGFNAFTVLVGASAVWMAYDSYALRAREYRTALGQHPLAVGFLAVVFWPIVLPGWLATRRRIQLGEVERGAAPRWPLGCGAATVVVPALLFGAVWLASDQLREANADLRPLIPVLQSMQHEFGATRVNLSESPGDRFVIALDLPEAPADLHEHSLEVARFFVERVDSVSAVTVEYAVVRERGALLTSRGIGSVTWSAAQIAEAEARGRMPRDSLRLVLAYRPDARGAHLEPIAILDSAGAFHAPPYLAEADSGRRLLAEQLAPGTRWFAGSGGRVAAPLEVVSSAQTECYGLHARARRTTETPAPASVGIALRDSSALGPFVFTATASDERLARTAATALLQRNGVTADAIASVEWGSTRVVMEEAASTIVAYGSVPGDRGPAFFVALVTNEAPAAVAPFTIFDDASYVERRRPELFDVADVDGDGAPEMILLNRYYESWTYTVLKRTASGWRLVYEGGGSGC